MIEYVLMLVFCLLIIYYIFDYCNTPKVVIIDSGVPGKTIGIVGSIHGNEIAGAETLDALIISKYKPPSGKLKLIYANRGGRLTNLRMNPAALVDTNRQFFDTNIDTSINNSNNKQIITNALARNVFNQLTDCDLVIDLHEGWGYYLGPTKDDVRSIGSTLSPSADAFWQELAPQIIDKLNCNLADKNSYKKFTILWNRYCEIETSLNCYSHKKRIPYILVETSGQNNIQPIEIRVSQMYVVIDIICNNIDKYLE